MREKGHQLKMCLETMNGCQVNLGPLPGMAERGDRGLGWGEGSVYCGVVYTFMVQDLRSGMTQIGPPSTLCPLTLEVDMARWAFLKIDM